MADTIRRRIIRTISSFGIEADESVVEMLAAKVEACRPEKPLAFAHAAAHNWAISQQRKADAAPRIEARRVSREARETAMLEAERVWNEKKAAARDEFWVAAVRALRTRVNNSSHVRVDEHLYLLYLTVFAGQPFGELEQLFRITSETRYKWLQRARDLLRPHASAVLNEAVRGRQS